MDGSFHLDSALTRHPESNPLRGIMIGVALSALLWAIIAALVALFLFGWPVAD